MSASYLLPCSCGEPIKVTPSQAGGLVTCSCGVQAEVPRLRDLRELPLASEAAEPTQSWGLRSAIISVGLIMALALGGVGAWLMWTEPAAPQDFDAAAYLQSIDRGIDKLSPAESYELWTARYQPLSTIGFLDPRGDQVERINSVISSWQWYRNLAFAAAGGVLLVAIAIAATVRT